jgi:hypothetical protein
MVLKVDTEPKEKTPIRLPARTVEVVNTENLAPVEEIEETAYAPIDPAKAAELFGHRVDSHL